MLKLKNTFAIGCLVQWYEVEIFDEYFQSLKMAIQDVENKENVVIDICFNMSQSLEKIDESQMKLDDIFHRFLKIRADLDKTHIKAKVNFYPNSKTEFNNKKLNSYFKFIIGPIFIFYL